MPRKRLMESRARLIIIKMPRYRTGSRDANFHVIDSFCQAAFNEDEKSKNRIQNITQRANGISAVISTTLSCYGRDL